MEGDGKCSISKRPHRRERLCPFAKVSFCRCKLEEMILNLVLQKRCSECGSRTCKCWAYHRSDGVCEGFLMEAIREPVVPPGGGTKPGGGIFFPSSGAPRPPKSLSFSSPTGSSRFSPQNGTQPPPSYAAHSLTGGGCYRRASSVSRPSHPTGGGGGGYRTAGNYRNRSGSVPPPAENGKGGISVSTSGGNSSSVRRSGISRAFPDGTILDGTNVNDSSHKVGSLNGRNAPAAAHNGLVWAQLDLLQMDCANSGGGGSHSQTCSENTSPTEAFSIGTEERLVKTNPIWFLADLHRVGAVHLLQGKEEGSFLVRQSSQSDTLAISVRLPPDKGPHVQHYLVEIQPQGQYSLEASDNRFASLPSLLSYYTEICDELPVKLKLPKCVQEAKTRHELASIALLGQEFWGTVMASPLPTPVSGEEKFLPLKSPTLRPCDLSFSSFGKGSLSKSNLSNSNSPLTPMGNHLGDSTLSLTPTRPAPPIPSAIDRSNLNLNLSSHEEVCDEPMSPQFSSFKSQPHTPQTSQPPRKPTPPPRSSPPNAAVKPSKPIPPVRSSHPTDPAQSPSNITVTTTLTFNVNQIKNLPLGGSSPSTPSSNEDYSREGIQLHVSSLEISPCSSGTSSSNCRESLKLHFRPPYSSPPSQPQTPITPLSENSSEGKVRLRKGKGKRKDSGASKRSSSHYHDSSVLIEQPFHRSSLADKISDYEDLWTTPPCDVVVGGVGGGFFSPTVESSRTPIMQSFKPGTNISKSMGDLSDVIRREREGRNQNGVGSSEESLEGRQASSPFYVEPLDALRKYREQTAGGSPVNDRGQSRPRIRKTSRKLPANRHSDSNIEIRSRRARNVLARIEDNGLEDNLSSSQEEMDNFDFEDTNNALNSSRTNINGGRRSKPVVPPKLSSGKSVNDRPNNANRPAHNWIDASWEFLSYIGNTSSSDGDSALIPGELTVQSLIKKRLPHLILNNNLLNNPYQSHSNKMGPNFSTNLTKSCSRYSEYDNVGFGSKNDCRIPRNDSDLSHYIPSSVSDSGTEFSEPWDSRKWDSLLQDSSTNQQRFEPQLDDQSTNLNNYRGGSQRKLETDSDTDSLVQVTGESACDSNEESHSLAPNMSFSQKSNMDTNLRSKILSPQMLALRHRKDAESGAAVRRYALSLGYDSSTTFSQAIRHFLTCTLESTEKEATVVVRNVRQFMSGMKNYLVTSGEGEFEPIVTRERSNLKPNEFLNLDAILEDVLVRLVLRPLWTHINQLYVDSLTNEGSIQKLADNIASAKTLPYSKLGIKSDLVPPKGTALEAIQILLLKMQHVFAPREKLAHLLGMISHLYHAMYENGAGVAGTGDADDLVPMIMYVLIQCEVVSAEVEADYIQGLLLPSTASGEASYYLSAFQSAIHSLKNFDAKDSPNHSPGESLNSIAQESSCVSDHGVLRVIVPDEKNGSIVTRTLPIRPNSTAKELCRMMAHKLRVTNPQDYALYKLVDGHEWLLGDNECPQKIRNEVSAKGSHCLIAFKRIDAKIAWPLNN